MLKLDIICNFYCMMERSFFLFSSSSSNMELKLLKLDFIQKVGRSFRKKGFQSFETNLKD